MRFFHSNVHSPVFTGGDGWYFVTSEQNDGAFGNSSNPRMYTVRRMTKDADIDEPEGENAFQKYGTLAQARRVARQLAEQGKG